MARRGVAGFGRNPRAQTSLTNQLVNLAREQENQRDQNIMSAWQKGGLFEGKKVTDSMVLAHWKERMANLSHDDPNYDQYQEAYTQYQYAIEESKTTAAYAQHKLSDSQVAAFYINWSKKVPKDSEFYRALQRDGAQFMQAATAKGKAAAAAAKAKAYADGINNISKRDEATGNYLIDTLTTLAKNGAPNQGVALGGLIGSNENLFSFKADDPEQMLRLLSLITPPVHTNRVGGAPIYSGTQPTDGVLFHDENGKPVTGQTIAAQLGKLDPHFHAGGTIDLGYVKTKLDQQIRGVQARIDLATKTGHISDAARWKTDKSNLVSLAREVQVYPATQNYMHLRQAYYDVANDPSSLPQDKLAAYQKYTSGLKDLAGDPAIATDDAFRSAILGEANGDANTVTIGESFNRMGAGDTNGQNNDTVLQANQAAQWQADTDFMAKNADTAVYTTGKYDKQGVFTPQVGGPALGISDMATVQGTTGGVPLTMFIPSATGGKPVPVLVPPAAVYVTTGDLKATGADKPAGYIYSYTTGGHEQKFYGFQTGSGMKYFTDPPWDATLPTTQDSKGLHINISSIVQPGQTGVTVTPVRTTVYPGRSMTGQPITGKGVPGTDYTVVIDPTSALLGSDKAMNAAGPSPFTSFDNPILAGLMSTPEGQSMYSSLKDNPDFQRTLQLQDYALAGFQADGKGGWTPGVGDPLKLAQLHNQEALAGTTQADFNTWFTKAFSSFNKTTTTPLVGPKNTSPGKTQDDLLPLDKLAGTPLAAMGNATTPNTNLLTSGQTAQSDASEATRIKLAGTLTLPAVPATNIKPTGVPTVTSTTPSVAPQSASPNLAPPVGYDHGSSGNYTPPAPPSPPTGPHPL